jgi:periplasmic protein TonB
VKITNGYGLGFGTDEYRIGGAFALAAIIHAGLILGVNFSESNRHQSAKPMPIEVILVQEQSPNKPKAVDYLAQANLEGASFKHADRRPAAPLVAPQPDREAQIAEVPIPAQSLSTPGTTSADSSVTVSESKAHEDPMSQQRPKPVVSAAVAHAREVQPIHAPDPKPASESHTAHAQADAAHLISTSFAMASLNAEIDQRLESRSKRLRQKFVSASTQEYRFASYMEAWRAKVERIGNLNYPDEARQQHLSGNLLLDVSLNPDGSVLDIVIRRPSGHKELDDAAVRIVQLSAPFAPFPEDIRREIDVLHITRSWQFLHNFQFASKS